jgi:hypothetical protein
MDAIQAMSPVVTAVSAKIVSVTRTPSVAIMPGMEFVSRNVKTNVAVVVSQAVETAAATGMKIVNHALTIAVRVPLFAEMEIVVVARIV